MVSKLDILLQGCENDLSKSVFLLHYKYATQLCVNAEPLSLLPLEIAGLGKIETVADVVRPRKDQFQIFLRNKQHLQAVISAMRQLHPEFLLDIVPATFYKGQTEEENSLVYTMPPVNKERRDLLLQAVDFFYERQKTSFEKSKASWSANITRVMADQPQQADEGQKKLDLLFEKKSAQLAKIREDKITEIEEAYQRYETEHIEEPKPQPSEEGQENDRAMHSLKFEESWKEA